MVVQTLSLFFLTLSLSFSDLICQNLYAAATTSEIKTGSDFDLVPATSAIAIEPLLSDNHHTEFSEACPENELQKSLYCALRNRTDLAAERSGRITGMRRSQPLSSFTFFGKYFSRPPPLF